MICVVKHSHKKAILLHINEFILENDHFCVIGAVKHLTGVVIFLDTNVLIQIWHKDRLLVVNKLNQSCFPLMVPFGAARSCGYSVGTVIQTLLPSVSVGDAFACDLWWLT